MKITVHLINSAVWPVHRLFTLKLDLNYFANISIYAVTFQFLSCFTDKLQDSIRNKFLSKCVHVLQSVYAAPQNGCWLYFLISQAPLLTALVKLTFVMCTSQMCLDKTKTRSWTETRTPTHKHIYTRTHILLVVIFNV